MHALKKKAISYYAMRNLNIIRILYTDNKEKWIIRSPLIVNYLHY